LLKSVKNKGQNQGIVDVLLKPKKANSPSINIVTGSSKAT